MLSGRLVRELGELADQLLEHEAHLGVADDLGVQVDPRELLGHEVEQVRLRELVDLRVELEALEDVPHRSGEALDVRAQVLRDVVLVAHQLLQVERRRVEEELPGLLEQEGLGVQARGLSQRLFGQHRGLRGFESTQSRRRRTVKGRMTLPYSDCL